MWSKLGIRVASAAVGVVLVLLLIFSNQLIFNIAMCVVSLIAIYELYTTFSQSKKWPLLILYYGFAAVVLGTLFIKPILFETANFSIIIVLYLMLLCLCAVIFNDTITMNDVLIAFFIPIYSVVFICHLSLIRGMENGTVLIFVPLLCAWMTDTFAYFGGIALGKHKLIPKVSPKKTVEGAISGVIGCILASLVFAWIISFSGYNTNIGLLCLLSLCSSVLSQFGDLTASLIKRSTGVKDFGNLIPGHGGILDRIDSLIFITPLCYYFLKFFEVIYK
ncbi:MAG: phosphatidate cytidylyltransferase [Clostridia bacterium]|nr:phosphatidate cytidylyltransferase [Clostridia bacterium]